MLILTKVKDELFVTKNRRLGDNTNNEAYLLYYEINQEFS